MYGSTGERRFEHILTWGGPPASHLLQCALVLKVATSSYLPSSMRIPSSPKPYWDVVGVIVSGQSIVS